MHLDLANLFCCHAAVSFGKQLRMADVVGSFNWHLDLSSGFLSFSDKYHWHTQLLGTQAEESQTWLWAWANEAGGIPTPLLGSALTLRMLGEASGISELAEPELSLRQIDGHTLAIIGSGVCHADAYYCCPYDGGALFVLIKDENFPKRTDPPLQRIATVFPQAISSLDIPDHKLALTGYLDSYMLRYEQDGDKIVVKENGEAVLTAMFDEQNRLTNLEVRLASDVNDRDDSSPGESWDDGQLRRMLGG